MVYPHAPPTMAAGHFEHGDLLRRAGSKVGCDLVVDRRLVRLCDLVVEVVRLASGEAAETDLDPLVGSVRPRADTPDPDPAGHMTAQHLRGTERRQFSRQSVDAVVSGEAGVCVSTRAACRRGSRGLSDRTGEQTDPDKRCCKR